MIRPPLTFNPDGHVYRDSNGVRVPSVTQIMEAAGLQDFSGVAPEILKAAQERGSEVHHICALDDLGMLDESTVDPQLIGYLYGWRAYRATVGAVVLSTERLVWNAVYGYAGTFDNFLEDNQGTFWLIDRKTGPEHAAHEVQLGAYWEAIKASATEMFPPIGFDISKVRFASVHLKADGSYKMSEHDAKKGWAMFCTCLSLYKWKLNNGLLKAA